MVENKETSKYGTRLRMIITKMTQHIGLLCYDVEDARSLFRSWPAELGKPVSINPIQRTVHSDNGNIYFLFTKFNDILGLHLHDVLATDHARLRKDFEQIMTQARTRIR